MEGYKGMARLFKALAHPVRLRILEIIGQEGEACVCHLEATLGRRQAYISQQLAQLRDAGLVVDRREGVNVFYTLADAGVQRLLDAARALRSAEGAARGDRSVEEALSGPAKSCLCPRCEPAGTNAVVQGGAPTLS